MNKVHNLILWAQSKFYSLFTDLFCSLLTSLFISGCAEKNTEERGRDSPVKATCVSNFLWVKHLLPPSWSVQISEHFRFYYFHFTDNIFFKSYNQVIKHLIKNSKHVHLTSIYYRDRLIFQLANYITQGTSLLETFGIC